MPAHYRPDQGIGPTVLLCHGFPEDFRYWHEAEVRIAYLSGIRPV